MRDINSMVVGKGHGFKEICHAGCFWGGLDGEEQKNLYIKDCCGLIVLQMCCSICFRFDILWCKSEPSP